MKIRQKIKNMSTASKIGLLLAMTLILSTGVFAAWQIYFQDNLIVNVDSTQAITTLSFFENIDMETTSEAQMNSSTATIRNDDGPLEFLFTELTERTDTNLSDSCEDFETDCLVTFEVNAIPISSGTNVTIPSGISNITAGISCEAFACPQMLNITAGLTLV